MQLTRQQLQTMKYALESALSIINKQLLRGEEGQRDGVSTPTTRSAKKPLSEEELRRKSDRLLQRLR